MPPFYYALGAVAKLNERMWRHRHNFLPINVFVIVMLIGAGYGKAADAMEGLQPAYLFAEGERPNAVISGLVSALLFGVAVLFAIATAKRNTIFQRANFGSPVSRVKTPESLIVGATGTFEFDREGKNVERRFIDMPAVLAHDENGDPVLASNIDASTRSMGVTLSRLRGIWTLGIDAGSVHDMQSGFLYWGTARRPAFRFSYTNGDGANRGAIISAVDGPTLTTAVAMLTSMPSSRGAPTT